MHYAGRCLPCRKDIAVLGQFCTECMTYPLQVQPHYWPRCRRVPGLFKII